MLSHYDAVLWYTGDDYLTRRPGQPAGTGTARLAVEEMIDVRHFLNEGGKLFYTGKSAGQQYAEGNPFRNFGFPEPPEGGAWCSNALPEFDEDNPANADGCIAHNDDFLQYHLGAYIYAAPGNTFDDENGRPYALRGTGPFAGLSWQFDETGANNQDHSATFVITSSVLDPARYPTFADSRSVADWLRPGAAPFSPYSGTQYFSAGADSTSYKRLGKTFDLTGRTAPKLNFKVSADLEPDWDWMIVEARDVTTDPNSDAWTTLPEADTDGAGPDVSLTTTSTGASCPEGLATDSDAPHPFLLHYWSATCEPHGHDRHVERASPAPPAAGRTGTSTCPPTRARRSTCGSRVITDWSTLGLGAWVDDVRLTDGATSIEFNDFEADDGRLGRRPAAGGHRQPDQRLDASRRPVRRGRHRRHRRHAVHRASASRASTSRRATSS